MSSKKAPKFDFSEDIDEVENNVQRISFAGGSKQKSSTKKFDTNLDEVDENQVYNFSFDSQKMSKPEPDFDEMSEDVDEDKVYEFSFDSAPKWKVQMNNLTISDKAHLMIKETLKFITGQEFEAKNTSAYKDKGTRLSSQYWVNQENLVIEGVTDYSNQNVKQLSSQEKVNMFAMAKLEKYGFHASHCEEALQHTSHDVGNAYEVLMSHYFLINLPDPTVEVPESIIEERKQEMEAISSIYDGDFFEERLVNQLWVLHLDLPYLADIYCEKVEIKNDEENSIVNKKTKEICKFFLKGKCRYGPLCRFSHDTPVPKPRIQFVDEEYEAERTKFDLEIRFPKGCRYPKEAPLVSIYPLKCSMPCQARLLLTAHLMELARRTAVDESPALYCLVDFLQSQSREVLDLVTHLGSTSLFIKPTEKLFKSETDDIKSDTISDKDIQIKARKLERRSSFILKTIENEDNGLCKDFFKKQENPKYKSFLHSRKQLPAWSMKENVLQAIRNNQVTIISGETGCGKSTQVPQFIMDDWMTNREQSGKHVEIVCTQPRKLSAIGVAERVAEERLERLGGCVGYQIRLESRVSSTTRLLFCTTGILLRRLESDTKLSTVTHIIVDEVHERTVESDFLLAILKQLLPERPDLRVILMSATLNADLFCQYFEDAPIVKIPGKTFPVEQYFLEDIIEDSGYVLEECSKYTRYLGKSSAALKSLETELEIADLKSEGMIANSKTADSNLTIRQLFYRYDDYSKRTCKSIYLMDTEKINYELIEWVLMWIVNGDHEHEKSGAILVFLPGMAEIVLLHDQLKDHSVFSPKNGNFILVPLHSSLSNEEQANVFMKTKPGQRKIVMTTNIAETSITIDDCVYVIDCGRMKEKRFDSNKNMESLDTVWVSQANAKQRRGRAGRVKKGVCIHLYTRHHHGYHLLAQPVPEIHRIPLEQIILRIKMLPNLAHLSLEDVLDMLIEPPEKYNVLSAVIRLKNIGALDNEGALTPLGRHLGALPVDVRIGKLMLFGSIFYCLDSALTIAASLSYKSPFVAPFVNREQADVKKKEFATGNSDHLTILKAYTNWKKAYSEGVKAGYVFANENFLSQRTLIALADMKTQFLELLSSIGFAPEYVRNRRRVGSDNVLEYTGPEFNVNGENQKLLAAIVCASLYPNIVKVLTPEKLYSQSAAGAIPRPMKPDTLKFKTKDNEFVNIHPSSVNFSSTHFSSPYLVYQEKVKTSRVFIRETSMVPALSMVLFCGSDLNVELHAGTFVVSLVDGWILFSVSKHEVAELLKCIRSQLLELLDEKISNPSLDLLSYPKGRKIISTIVYLVTHG